jgi:hypothetical protein
MNKKHILVILLPCLLFASCAIFELHFSGFFSTNAEQLQSGQKSFEQFYSGVSSGEVGKDAIVEVVHNLRDTQLHLDALASRWFTCMAWVMLACAALQVGLVFLFCRMKKTPNTALEPTPTAP